MFVVSRDKSLEDPCRFSLEERGGFGKTHCCKLSIVTQDKQARSRCRIQSDNFFAIQPEATEFKNRFAFHFQSSSDYPPGIVFHGPHYLPTKIDLRGRYPCNYNLPVNGNRCSFVFKGLHPPRLFTSSTFQVPSRISGERSKKVLCSVHLDSCFPV